MATAFRRPESPLSGMSRFRPESTSGKALARTVSGTRFSSTPAREMLQAGASSSSRAAGSLLRVPVSPLPPAEEESTSPTGRGRTTSASLSKVTSRARAGWTNMSRDPATTPRAPRRGGVGYERVGADARARHEPGRGPDRPDDPGLRPAWTHAPVFGIRQDPGLR